MDRCTRVFPADNVTPAKSTASQSPPEIPKLAKLVHARALKTATSATHVLCVRSGTRAGTDIAGSCAAAPFPKQSHFERETSNC
jgi:ribosomal protein L37E